MNSDRLVVGSNLTRCNFVLASIRYAPLDILAAPRPRPGRAFSAPRAPCAPAPLPTLDARRRSAGHSYGGALLGTHTAALCWALTRRRFVRRRFAAVQEVLELGDAAPPLKFAAVKSAARAIEKAVRAYGQVRISCVLHVYLYLYLYPVSTAISLSMAIS